MSAGTRTAVVLTAEQRSAVEFEAGPLLVVAGAGTGKTTVMAERIVHLVATGACTPDQVLGLTFTNKAAAHLRREVVRRLDPDADVTVSTYHAFGARLVAGHALELDLDRDTQILNRAQAWQLLFAVFDEFRFERRRTFRPGAIVDHALELASRCADHLVPVEAVEADCAELAEGARWKTARDTALSRRELCQVVSRYAQRKRERNLLDYGDQVALAVRLLEERPEVAAALRAQHPVVLLDEYQDTNYAQRRLLQLLYPPGSPITAVGDDMQSIYGFRGAHLGNILGFEDHFPPVTVKPLETNRRSGAELVALANRIQAQVSRSLPKTLAALPSAPATAIECFLAADDAEEAAEIARDVARRGEPWSDHTVLCRKRRLIPAVVDALETAGVPVEVVGSGGLLDRPEVVDLVAWLETLADLGSTVALLRILEGPRYRIGRRDLAALARHVRWLTAAGDGDDEKGDAADLADALEDLDGVADLSAAARGRLTEFCAERRALSSAAARLSVLDLAEAVILRTGLWSASGDKGRENLLRFLDLAARFAPVEGDPGLLAFLEYLHLLDETEEDLAQAHRTDLEAVQVMTVHQAKGLEFPNVWVPGLAGGEGQGAGIFPDSRAGENPVSQSSALPWWLRPDDEGMPHWRTVGRMADIDEEVRRRRQDEEWRLFYVACTRARRLLVCSAAHWYPGPAEPQGPSAFYRFVAAQTDLVTERFRHDPPATDPEVAAKERRRATAARRYAAPAVARDQPASLFDDASLPPATTAPSRSAPAALSVTSLVSYARCPRQFFWSVVRPLPRRASGAARVGQEVHRWIELRAGRQLALLEPEPEVEHDPGAGGRLEQTALAGLRASFLGGPFADVDPARVEAPFELALAGRLVRGRVDAVYESEGRVELVDFKTGRRPATGDAGATVQLELYALAAVDAWRADPDRLRTTYCYLDRDGRPAELDSHDWDAAAVAAVRDRLAASLEALNGERWRTTPGAWCQRCDFLDFCADGRAILDAGADRTTHPRPPS